MSNYFSLGILELGILEKEDYYRGYLELLEQLTSVESEKITYAEFCKQLEKIQSYVVVIRDNYRNNKVVGTASLFIEKKFIHKLSSVGHIEDVVVDNMYRNSGIGKVIIENLIEEAMVNNCYKIILNCSKQKVEFYKKCGFNETNVEMSKYFISKL